MTPALHRRLVKTAARVSRPLAHALTRAGRLALPKRNRRGLARFLARAVVGQQLSTAAARTIWARVEACVRADGECMPDFFRGGKVRALRRCGVSHAKIRALIAIREAGDSGLLSARRLARMSHAQRSEHLRRIRGVGQWTADMASIFYFGDPDVWPEGDIGVRRGLERLVGRRSKKAMHGIASAFAPYRSFLALYMWRVLEQPAAAPSKQPL